MEERALRPLEASAFGWDSTTHQPWLEGRLQLAGPSVLPLDASKEWMRFQIIGP